uniref:Uncharacterized protein n=1 Tax=Timema poppense TaxID=170557 RepID=A0A7R9DHQ4_TIMPO|nr:unnamed protein product [Timema poppensis]
MVCKVQCAHRPERVEGVQGALYGVLVIGPYVQNKEENNVLCPCSRVDFHLQDKALRPACSVGLAVLRCRHHLVPFSCVTIWLAHVQERWIENTKQVLQRKEEHGSHFTSLPLDRGKRPLLEENHSLALYTPAPDLVFILSELVREECEALNATC